MIRVYLDTCVWGRPFDDQNQREIRNETLAFFEIANFVDKNVVEISGSEVLLAELQDISNKNKRKIIEMLVNKGTTRIIPLYRETKEFAKEISEICNLKGVDSLHLASAKLGNTNYFITTDTEMLKKAKCLYESFNIKVLNPVKFVRFLK